MKKLKFIHLFFVVFGFLFSSAQVKSPSEFLGYELGSKWTPHHKVVDYTKYIAASFPTKTKLLQYGSTHEDRPLYLLIISSEKNMANLEAIRKENLQIAAGTQKPTANSVAISWMSYDVHGNEASCTEVALKLMHELLAGKKNSAALLEKQVVIIDPCLNPDGRDRYVNWFNSVVGKKPNPKPEAREHEEPWPGGRVNHYYFDLNRDWVWQTQPETKARIKVYRQWMPHVHADYHEQGVESPYYFAPAAEPQHEAVTNWQRNIQVTFGKNHAKYFDEKNWLYFTKEIFDILYPGYGDSYPMYNGSIGMTYEQAGHTRSGLAIIKSDGDTLTLQERIEHHFTTSMSTLEVAAQYKDDLLNAFSNYFSENIKKSYNGINAYIITDNNKNKIDEMHNFLQLNGIEVTKITNDNIATQGYRYSTQKQEIPQLKKYSLFVKTTQPNGRLANVLLEPKTKISDTATYDITSWALPFAYSVEAYAFTSLPVVKTLANNEEIKNTPCTNCMGYAIKYEGINTIISLGKLHEAGIKVRISEVDFTIGKESFPKGSLICLSNNANEKSKIFNVLNSDNKTKIYPITTGFVDKGADFGSFKIKTLRKPNICLVTGKQTLSYNNGDVWHFIEQKLDYPVTLVNHDDLDEATMAKYNVIIFTYGYHKFLNDKDQFNSIKNWVRSGGTLIALENAVASIAKNEIGLVAKKPEEKKDEGKVDYSVLKKYENKDRDGLEYNLPGVVIKTDVDNTHPIAYGSENFYYTLKQDGSLYDYLKTGWNVATIKKNPQIAGHLGYKAKEKLADATVIGVIPMGSGNIVCFSDNVLFRNFWKGGELFFANALFMVQ